MFPLNSSRLHASARETSVSISYEPFVHGYLSFPSSSSPAMDLSSSSEASGCCAFSLSSSLLLNLAPILIKLLKWCSALLGVRRRRAALKLGNDAQKLLLVRVALQLEADRVVRPRSFELLCHFFPCPLVRQRDGG